MGAFSFLDRSHSVANPGFSGWLVPPAALSIHLAIGHVYAFSVFKKPLNYLVTRPPRAEFSDDLLLCRRTPDSTSKMLRFS